MKPIVESFDIYRGPVISLTDFCNMSCSYCSRNCEANKQTHLPFEQVIKIIDFFSERNSCGPKHVQLTGGEALAYPYIFEVIEYLLKKGFICRLQTNGILLKGAVQKRPDLFSHPLMIIKVSLDGWDKKTHGYYRGENSFIPCFRKKSREYL